MLVSLRYNFLVSLIKVNINITLQYTITCINCIYHITWVIIWRLMLKTNSKHVMPEIAARNLKKNKRRKSMLTFHRSVMKTNNISKVKTTTWYKCRKLKRRKLWCVDIFILHFENSYSIKMSNSGKNIKFNVKVRRLF